MRGQKQTIKFSFIEFDYSWANNHRIIVSKVDLVGI